MKKILPENIYLHWLRQNLELVFWVAAICLLFFLNPGYSKKSFCIFRLVGFESCPGCGLGHDINAALHLNFIRSFREHFFGLPATAIILHRIIQLIKYKKAPVYES